MMRSTALLAWLAAAVCGCSSADGSGLPGPGAQSGIEGGVDAAVASDAEIEAGLEAEPQDAPLEALVETSTGPEASVDSGIPGADCESSDEHRFACCAFTAVNEYRTSLGLAALIWDPQIAVAAEWYSQYMADVGLLEHGLDGRMVGTRLSDFGVDWTAAGENIARNTTDAWQDSCVQVFDQWYGSPSHHALMVSTKYTHGAVGAARGGGWWYATLNVVAH